LDKEIKIPYISISCLDKIFEFLEIKFHFKNIYFRLNYVLSSY